MKEMTLELTMKVTQIAKFDDEQLAKWEHVKEVALAEFAAMVKSEAEADNVVITNVKEFIRDIDEEAAQQ